MTRQFTAVEPKLLELLVCPLTKAKLVRVGDWLVSTDPLTRRRYRIEDDIPNMMVNDSDVLSEEEWRAMMEQGLNE